MYICICNALKECDLKEACKRSCARDGESVLQQAGCNAECGQCLDYIESFVIPEAPFSPSSYKPNLT